LNPVEEELAGQDLPQVQRVPFIRRLVKEVFHKAKEQCISMIPPPGLCQIPRLISLILQRPEFIEDSFSFRSLATNYTPK